jgi:protein arginine N-methyltransferase 1
MIKSILKFNNFISNKIINSIEILRKKSIEIKQEKAFFNYDIHKYMISDEKRMKAYYKAINKYIKKNHVVIDLGTGTGILAFFAHKKNPEKIYAIDHSNFIENAKLVAKHNKFGNITFIKKNSHNFNLNKRIDIIIQEQMGYALFNEYMLDSIIDLRDRLLKKGGRILPNKFEVFLAPCQINNINIIDHFYDTKHYGVDFSCLKNREKNFNAKPRIISFRQEYFDFFLSKPKKVCSFDLEKIRSKEEISQMRFTSKIIKNGRLDGFCGYFKVFFDDQIYFNTSPLGKKDSFGPFLLKAESKKVKKGTTIEFKLEAKDISNLLTWKWKYKKN